MKQFILFSALFFLLTNLSAQINTERFRIDQKDLGFAGEAGIGINVRTGNTDLQLINGRGRINFNGGFYYSFIVVGGDFGWKSGVQFSNEALIHLRFVPSLTRITQLEVFGQVDYNKARKLMFRKLAGSGFRFKAYRDSILKFTFGTGFMLENEKYELPNGSQHPHNETFVRSTNYINTEIKLSESADFLSIIYFQPAVTILSDYKILSENSFTAKISKHLDMEILFTLRDDNNPPDKVKKLDINSSFGFKIKF